MTNLLFPYIKYFSDDNRIRLINLLSKLSTKHVNAIYNRLIVRILHMMKYNMNSYIEEVVIELLENIVISNNYLPILEVNRGQDFNLDIELLNYNNLNNYKIALIDLNAKLVISEYVENIVTNNFSLSVKDFPYPKNTIRLLYIIGESIYGEGHIVLGKLYFITDEDIDRTNEEYIAPPITIPVAAPISNISNNTSFENNLSFTLTSESGTIIYYTLDGNNPTTSSSIYTGEITITDTTTLKAIAVRTSDNVQSTIAIYNYIKEVVTLIINNPLISPTVSSFENSLTVSITQDQNYPIYYTLDGNEPNENSTLYISAFDITESTVVKAISKYSTFSSSVVTQSYTVIVPQMFEPEAKMSIMKQAGYMFTDKPQNFYDSETYVATINTSSPPGGLSPILTNGTDQSVRLQAIFDYIDSTYAEIYDHNNRIKLTFPSNFTLTDSVYVSSFTHLDFKTNNTIVTLKPSDVIKYTDFVNYGTDAAEPTFESDWTDPNNPSDTEVGGWIFPGLAFIVFGTKKVFSAYQQAYDNALANNPLDAKLYVATINKHWKMGGLVDQTNAFAAYKGDTSILLDSTVNSTIRSKFEIGRWVLVFVPNDVDFFESLSQPSNRYFDTPHTRTWLARVIDYNPTTYEVELDRPFPYDIPSNHTTGGSVGGSGSTVLTKLVPLETTIGSGIGGGTINIDINSAPKNTSGNYTMVVDTPNEDVSIDGRSVKFEYFNLAPEYAIHSVLFRECTHCYVENAKFDVAGSHPIATEFAVHCNIRYNTFGHSLNKGKGGHGYIRGSKAHLCLFKGNTIKYLRHFTLQWGASYNVIVENNFGEVNLHGGNESYNLIESNNIQTPYLHKPGDEGSNNAWYPIYWSAAIKAHWATATGRYNVLHNNTMAKENASNVYNNYLYTTLNKVYIFGWDRNTLNGTQWQHLKINNVDISDWAGNELVDFSVSPNSGVNGETQFNGSIYSYLKSLTNNVIPNETVYKIRPGIVGGTLDTTPPPTPSITSINNGDTQITVNWNSVSDPSTPIVYQLRHKLSTDSVWTTTSYVTGTVLTISGLTNGSVYNVQVRAKDNANNISAWSTSFNGSPTTIASDPNSGTASLSQVSGGSTITVTINKPTGTGPSGYSNLYRYYLYEKSASTQAGLDSVSYPASATRVESATTGGVPINTVTYNNTGNTIGTWYRYLVKTVWLNGSNQSNTPDILVETNAIQKT